MNLLYSVLTSLLVNFLPDGCTPGQGKGTELADLSQKPAGTEVAIFAGGCFWCTEAVFERLAGVTDVVSGYTAGSQEGPTYRQVSYGKTDHAEAVLIYYNPALVSYETLVAVFFATHDPTQLNRQGPDVGKQYRSGVYFRTETEKKIATDHIARLEASGKYGRKIVTEVEAFDKFWLAEKYHQDYYEINPGNPYIINIAVPKVKKFKKLFPALVKDKYKTE